MRTRRAVACLVALLGLASGCGGLDASEYRDQAARVCTVDARRIAALAAPTGAAAARRWVDRVLAIVHEDTDRLRALEPPGELRGRVAAALGAQQREVARLRTLRHELAASRPDRRALARGLRDLDRLSRQSDEAFRAAGLPECTSA